MPDPIQSPSNASWYPLAEGATTQENDAQMSSSALRPPSADAPPPTQSSMPPAAVAGPPPAASTAESGAQLLVLRHTAAKALATPEPSVLKAAWACRSDLGAVALAAGAAAATAVPTGGTASVVLAAGVLWAGHNFDKCATEHEAQQVKTAINDAATQECEAKGGIALLSSRGSVVCAVSK